MVSTEPRPLSSFVRRLMAAELQRRQQERERREERARKLREALESAYETVPGDPRLCIRRLEVVEHAARALGVSVLNNAFFGEVDAGARALGWQPIKNCNRALFRCVKRRDHDENEALAVSRANRHDPRSGRPLPTLPNGAAAR